MKNLLKAEDVSARLGITKSALAGIRRRYDGFPQPIKVTERILRWDEADIVKWLENAKKETENGKSERTG